MTTLLVVDDEPGILCSLADCLSSDSLKVVTATTAKEGIHLARTLRPDVALFDVRLPDMTGLEAYDCIRQFDPRMPIIIMTAYARMETAVEAMRRGAFDYLLKPVDMRQLQDALARAISVSRLNRVPAVLGNEDDSQDNDADLILGRSGAMQEIFKTIGRVAPQDATVLILGESGTGKELVARAIYHYSQRSERPFLAINCAALPETLLESELFGHERGAFTGADQRRIGKFEQVSGGTILLDEIGDMSPATQAKALRLLQQQQFERLGGNTTIQTDVRVIAATNRNIAAMVPQGNFRSDLFYRLNGITITLPPLRDRPEDIPLLARHFAQRYSRQMGQPSAFLTDEALEVLQQHLWPGNVRELESALKYAVIHAVGSVVTPDCLPDSCRQEYGAATARAELSNALANLSPRGPGVGPAMNLAADGPIAQLARRLLTEGSTNLYREAIAEVDHILLGMVMEHVGGNLQQAADILGISRMTLRTKLKYTREKKKEAQTGSEGTFDELQG